MDKALERQCKNSDLSLDINYPVEAKEMNQFFLTLEGGQIISMNVKSEKTL